MVKKTRPKFLRFAIPVVETLQELGGSGNASEVIDAVIEKMNIPQDEQEVTNKNGEPRVKNQIHWSRFYLAKTGYLDSSQRGVWTLTDKGLKAKLSDDDVLELFKQMQSRHREKAKTARAESNENDETAEEILDENGCDYRTQLLDILKSLSPNGFERICQRLLRESGFEQVTVTGKSGDGGIDGHGILQVNPFVSFNVLFQCKRYSHSVSCSQVRDFRGAMMGRADKGIIITTGIFTVDAKKEARRDGVPPIELVNGEQLVGMFELLELGLTPRKTYEIKDAFFDDFK